jgi:DNA-binding response OmpR family regulator
LATSGVAGAPLDDLLSRADEALVTARRRGDLVATSTVRDRDFPALLVGTALLTDTDPRLFPAVDALMRSAGLKTVRASDCDRAIDAVRTERPDLLLLDLLSPALRGFDMLRWLADYHTRPRTIVLAGRGQDDEVTQAFELGADDYVTRPFTPGDLIARMTRLLR